MTGDPMTLTDIVIVANPRQHRSYSGPARRRLHPSGRTVHHTAYSYDPGADPGIPQKPETARPQPPDQQHRPALSVAEAAKLLAISTSHAYQLVQSGAIPVIRLGRRVLIPHRSIDERLAP